MTAATEPVACHRCHGTGVDPGKRAPDSPEHQAVLAALREAGERRAAVNRHTSEGRMALNEAYADIRTYGAQADELGITRNQTATAVGVSRSRLHIIMAGKTAV